MTADERKQLADRMMAEHMVHQAFIRGSIGLLSLLPILYGLLTWVFGDDLWSGSEIYATALTVPGAPQSWGTIFLVLGLVLMTGALRVHLRLVAWVSLLTALILATFMVMFGVEYLARQNESSLPPALAWGVFSLLFLNLWWLAHKMDRISRGRQNFQDG